MYGLITLRTVPASVHRMVVSAFKGIINLNPNVIDGLKATNDRMIIKDELETMQKVTIVCEGVVCCPIITAGWTQNIQDKHESRQNCLVQIRKREI